VVALQDIAASVAKVALGIDGCIYAANLSAGYKGHTHRDIIRMCFAEVGIDIEFSGKDRYEKAVIIDMDDDRITELGLDSDTFRFGETVVRVNEQLSPLRETDSITTEDIEMQVADLMTKALELAKQP